MLQNTDEIQGKQNVQEIDAAKCASDDKIWETSQGLDKVWRLE